jgi:hypothetical protein
MRDNNRMATDGNIKLPEDLLAQVQDVMRPGETADDVAAAAIKKEVARRLLATLPSKASGMTEEQEIQSAVRAVHDSRRGR